VPAELALLVFDDPGRQRDLAHRGDHIVGELRPCADLVDGCDDLLRQLRLLLIGRPASPPPVIQLAPAVDQLEHAGQAVECQSVIHVEKLQQLPADQT
jgi:hypothetical protein